MHSHLTQEREEGRAAVEHLARGEAQAAEQGIEGLIFRQKDGCLQVCAVERCGQASDLRDNDVLMKSLSVLLALCLLCLLLNRC